MTKSMMNLVAAVCFALMIGACTNSSESTDAAKTEEADSKSMKAVAEAEAAEEAFAKEKNDKKKRGVASVKKSKNSESIFVVQVGTFSVEENAKKITEKLKSAGLPVSQKKIESENGKVFYAVRLEPTPNRIEAEKFVSTVKAATGESSLILSVGK